MSQLTSPTSLSLSLSLSLSFSLFVSLSFSLFVSLSFSLFVSLSLSLSLSPSSSIYLSIFVFLFFFLLLPFPLSFSNSYFSHRFFLFPPHSHILNLFTSRFFSLYLCCPCLSLIVTFPTVHVYISFYISCS